jgi:hypothetical protein
VTTTPLPFEAETPASGGEKPPEEEPVPADEPETVH